MSAWSAFGFGLLLGALIFDQLWRHVRRLERRLAVMRGFDGYYSRADVDAAYERIKHTTFDASVD